MAITENKTGGKPINPFELTLQEWREAQGADQADQNQSIPEMAKGLTDNLQGKTKLVEQKKGSNVIGDFLSGLAQGVGAVAKVGAAVVAPGSVNAFFEQRQKLANNTLEAAAKEYIANNQGQDMDINTVINQLRKDYPEDFKHADLSKVYDGVTNAFEPVVKFEKDKATNSDLYKKKLFDAWYHDRTGIGSEGSFRQIPVGMTKLREMMENDLGLRFQYKEDDPRTGEKIYQLTKETPIDQAKRDQIFKWSKDFDIPAEWIRNTFDLDLEPTVREKELDLKYDNLNQKKAWQEYRMKAGSKMSYSQWTSLLNSARAFYRDDTSGSLPEFDVFVDRLAKMDASVLSGYGNLTPFEKENIKTYTKIYDNNINDADAIVKDIGLTAQSFIGEYGVPSMPSSYYLEESPVKKKKYESALAKVRAAFNIKIEKNKLLINKLKDAGWESALDSEDVVVDEKYVKTFEAEVDGKKTNVGQTRDNKYFNIETGKEVFMPK